ncbi:MAG: phosphatase PAP2 family protein [Oscillospiraceae bacterium]|nr:phosphatase PAP2 family protein [Oscillospiraceae bacterium]
MKNENKKALWAAAWLLLAFALWTAAARFLDVQAIGPQGSSVGMAALNGAFHRLTGVHMPLYEITDWLGLAPLCVALGFAVLGLAQLIRRKSLLRVDRSILALGGFYLLVMGAYALFEVVVVNYRPVLIEGYLEGSYPSSTTMLALCVMPTAAMQLHSRMQNSALRRALLWLIGAFTAFMVVGRALSGVHWLSDIIGGVLLSAGLVALYVAASREKGREA